MIGHHHTNIKEVVYDRPSHTNIKEVVYMIGHHTQTSSTGSWSNSSRPVPNRPAVPSKSGPTGTPAKSWVHWYTNSSRALSHKHQGLGP